VEHVVVPAGYESAYPYDPSGKMPGPEDSEIPDPLMWLSYLAAATSRIKLATGILILPQRNPVVLAKELATLDVLSGGRLLLGIGWVGWRRSSTPSGCRSTERGRRTDDHVAAMRALWTQDKATYRSEFVSFTEDCISRPRPAQGSVPVHVGGHTDAAARRAGRLGDGFFPGKGEPRRVGSPLRPGAGHRPGARVATPTAIEMTTGGQRCRWATTGPRRGEGARRPGCQTG
jgi:probable F420-dependent oxidoreductase